MQTKLSSKGQIVVPVAVRTKLSLKPGELLDLSVEGCRIVLSSAKRKTRKGRLIKHPISGLPVVTFGTGAPVITSKMVAKLLEDFP